MFLKIAIIILITVLLIFIYIQISKRLIMKVSEAKAAAINMSLQTYKPSMSFEGVCAYLDKLIMDEYTLKYQMNVFLKGKYFLHDYDRDEVEKELQEFASDIIKMISVPMQRELEYYYNSEEIERLIVRRCNLLLMTYIQQKKQEKQPKTIIRG